MAIALTVLSDRLGKPGRMQMRVLRPLAVRSRTEEDRLLLARAQESTTAQQLRSQVPPMGLAAKMLPMPLPNAVQLHQQQIGVERKKNTTVQRQLVIVLELLAKTRWEALM